MRKNDRILILLIFIFCLALRLALITQKNLWFDELYSWKMVQGSFRDIIVGTADDIHPPLFYFALKIWDSSFGDSVFSMRLMTAIFTSSAVFFIYPVSLRVLNRTSTLLVLLLYSLSPLNLFFSQEVRMASLNVLLNTASVYFFIKLLDDKTERKPYKNIHVYLYILTTVLALYTHYFSFFILAAQLLYLIILYRTNIKSILGFIWLYLIIALSYLAWLPTMLKQVSRGQPWRYGQGLMSVLNEALIYSRDVSMGFYHRYINYSFLMILTLIMLVVIILSLIGFFKNPNGKDAKESISRKNIRILIVLLVFVPLLFSMVVSLKQSIEFFRYLSILVPFIIIMGFIGYQAYPASVKLIVLAVVVVINLYGDLLYYKYDFKNDDYREIIGIINAEYTPDDRVYVYPHYFAWSVDYYCKVDKLRYPGSNSYGWEYESLLDTLRTNPPKQFWFVLDYHSPDSATYNEKIQAIRTNYNIELKKTFFIIPDKVTLFKFTRK